MRTILAFVLLLPVATLAADITLTNTISYVSDESSLKGRRAESLTPEDPDSTEFRIVDWAMAENFGDMKSKVKFYWMPKSDQGPTIKFETTDKPHNQINIRSRTKSSLIVVTSTSNFYSSESWTFVFNFNLETVIATRVLSNGAGVGSELITYNCRFEPGGAN
ncbi:MAG: hypothetical protein ACR2QW_18810 [bacterium]